MRLRRRFSLQFLLGAITLLAIGSALTSIPIRQHAAELSQLERFECKFDLRAEFNLNQDFVE